MPTNISREDVQRLVGEGAQLVEVLPPREYEDEHLPGAINIPLKKLTAESAAVLRRDQPVIVYCFDSQWDLSPRAAWRLETLGFQRVHDYVAGKADWAAAGLQTEGRLASQPNAGDLARREVPTCGLADRVGDVRERVRASGQVIVVNEARVVLGRIESDALDGDPERPAESVMEAGPSTFRPNVPIEEMAEYMDKRDMDSAVITMSEGRLMGILYRADIDRAQGRAAGRRA